MWLMIDDREISRDIKSNKLKLKIKNLKKNLY